MSIKAGEIIHILNVCDSEVSSETINFLESYHLAWRDVEGFDQHIVNMQSAIESVDDPGVIDKSEINELYKLAEEADTCYIKFI